MRRGCLLLAALLGVGLAVGAATFAAVQGQPGKESSSVTATTPEPPKRDLWRHPHTGEEATLRFEDGVTRLERGGRVSEQGAPPFDGAAAKEETRAMLLAGGWNPFELRMLREMAQAGTLRENGRPLRVEEFGFPSRLWEELDAFEREMAGPEAVAGTLPSEDVPVDSLLWHPTPQTQKRFAELMAVVAENVQVHPSPADTPFHEQRRRLAREGFVRLSPRRADGSLWLPPELEPYRAPLEASERPVVRLAAEPARSPQPWQSKVGGVPYRPTGEAWPTAPDGRPLVFLAQLNFAELNPDGQALPDFPRRGVLQFFILNDMFYGADIGERYERTVQAPPERFRVLYWPEVSEDHAALEASMPRPEYDPQELAQLRAGGFEVLIDDSHLIDERLPHDPDREIALAAVPDREPVSGADDSSGPLLGLNLSAWEDARVQAVRSALYDLGPGGHKVGGFPDFTQQDPRRPEDDLMLLFQLDSDERLGLMWGDVGTANFFIRPGDLKRRDFSRVAYNWDSG